MPRSTLPALLVDLLEQMGNSCPVGQSLHPSIEKTLTIHWASA
jgi:hypothetical protein